MSTNRSQLLDWARALAIALVVCRHGYVLQLDTSAHALSWPLLARNLALNGWLGVDLFFVLSGFLLSRQLLGREGPTSAIDFVANFWRRRAYRIIPCYLIVVIPIWMSREYSGGTNATGHLQLLVHLLFLQDYFGSDLLVTTWSLATEEKFYLLLPFLVILSFRVLPERFAVGLLAVSALMLASRLITCYVLAPTSYSDFFWEVRAPFHNALDGLLMGMAAGYLIQANPDWLHRLLQRTTKRLFVALVLAAGALLISISWLDTSYLLSTLLIWFFSFIAAWLVVIGVSSEGKGLPLIRRSNVISWIATISYPLYLVHYLMLDPSQLLARLVSDNSQVQQFAFWGAYLTGSFAAAWLLHIFIEKPFLQLRGDRWRRADAKPSPL